MPQKKTILVVDDDPDFLDSVGALLRRSGYAVITAFDGDEAIAEARARGPDAIVLDVMMPRKDGYAACAELKADPATAGIPVLLLTAVAGQVTKTRFTHHDGMTTAADDYLDKACEPVDILARVTALLADRER
jgi:two-component system alkaline phosphatase synthesis response regulator PhoP